MDKIRKEMTHSPEWAKASQINKKIIAIVERGCSRGDVSQADAEVVNLIAQSLLSAHAEGLKEGWERRNNG